MKEFIEKLIVRLEELRIDKSNYFGVLNIVAEKYDRANEMLDDAIEIAKELAEKYQSRVMIDEQFCWQTCVCTDRCNECNRLADGEFDYYESIGEWEEEYINTSTDKSTEQPTWKQQTMNRFERVD